MKKKNFLNFLLYLGQECFRNWIHPIDTSNSEFSKIFWQALSLPAKIICKLLEFKHGYTYLKRAFPCESAKREKMKNEYEFLRNACNPSCLQFQLCFAIRPSKFVLLNFCMCSWWNEMMNAMQLFWIFPWNLPFQLQNASETAAQTQIIPLKFGCFLSFCSSS